MQSYPTKIDNVSSLGADEYNDFAGGELNNFVQESGQTLSSGDSSQMGKAAANYSSHGDFYTDSGSANAYVLASQASMQAVTGYIDGMRIRFKVGNANTGASTVNVNSLGVKDIVKEDGTALTSGLMALDEYVTIIYDLTNDRFFLFDPAASASFSLSVRTEDEDYTAVNTDGLILVDAIGGDITIDLFTAVGNVGKILTIKRKDDSFLVRDADFVDGDVTVGTDNINITSHNLQDLQRIQFASTGTLPAGISAATDYWVILIDNDNFKPAASLADAKADTPIDITGAAGGGTHTVTTQRNTVTIDANGTETIDGALTKTIASQNEALTIVSDDSDWEIDQREIPKEVIDAGVLVIQGTTTDPTKASVVDTDTFKFFREGEFLVGDCAYFASASAGSAAGSGQYSFLLPFALSGQSSLETDSSTSNFLYGSNVGHGIISSSTTNYIVQAFMFDLTSVGLVAQNATNGGKVDSGFNNINVASRAYRFQLRIPVEGWEI